MEVLVLFSAHPFVVLAFGLLVLLGVQWHLDRSATLARQQLLPWQLAKYGLTFGLVAFYARVHLQRLDAEQRQLAEAEHSARQAAQVKPYAPTPIPVVGRAERQQQMEEMYQRFERGGTSAREQP